MEATQFASCYRIVNFQLFIINYSSCGSVKSCLSSLLPQRSVARVEVPEALILLNRDTSRRSKLCRVSDSFDCVIPTREARHGRLYTKTGHMDIRRGYYSKDKKVIEKNCACHTCKSKISRSKIRELIKSPDKKLNAAGQRWCLLHNIWFFNNLVEEMRNSIQKGTFSTLKKEYLSSYDI